MGLISAGREAVAGTLGDQWLEFLTAPSFDELSLVLPAVGSSRQPRSGAHVLSHGSKIVVPEGAAAVITDGGHITNVSVEPGSFLFQNDGQPSLFTGSGPRTALIAQSWQRFKFGGQATQSQRLLFVNLREIRNIGFGTPSPIPYQDLSLVPGSGQAPVLRLRARGTFSVRVADPISFVQQFLPANTTYYSLADQGPKAQLVQEFVAAFEAALQSLSASVSIASLATHGPELAAAVTTHEGPSGSWLERFGLEVVSAAVSAIEYDQASRQLMDKYNQGALLQGPIGNAYAQSSVADAAVTMASHDGAATGLMGLAMGLNSMGSTLGGLSQPAASDAADPVTVLAQLKELLDRGLISAEQYAAKQREVLDRM